MSEQSSIISEALKNARIRWVIRQRVQTVDKRWLVDISDTEHERVARNEYETKVREHPTEYFELVAVVHTEVCQAFTAHR